MSTICDHSPRPYTIVEDILFECDLSSLQKLTLASLLRFAGKDDSAWPGLKRLARCTSSSVRQVQRILEELQKLQLLRIDRRAGTTSMYHIPELELIGKTLLGIWENSPQYKPTTPDTTSPLPCHDVVGGTTPCHGGGDMVSPKQYHLTSSNKNSHSTEGSTPSPAPEKLHQKKERENFNFDLIKAWNDQFATSHQPANDKEAEAMDWMLHAIGNQEISNIKSPVGYLKTVCRNGHRTDFPEFAKRKSKQTLPAYLIPSASEKWKLINQTHRQLFLMDAEDQGIPENKREEFAFQLFEKEYAQKQNQLQ